MIKEMGNRPEDIFLATRTASSCMRFEENETVKITKDLSNDVKKDDVGVILVAFDKPREAYEVEVLDENGKPKAQCTLSPNEMVRFC